MMESSIVKAKEDGTGLAIFAKADTSIHNALGIFGVREDGAIFSASGKAIYMSTDLGLNWKIETRGIDTTIKQIDNINVLQIALDSRGFIYLYGPNGLYKSTAGLDASKVKSRIAPLTNTAQNPLLNIYDLNGRRIFLRNQPEYLSMETNSIRFTDGAAYEQVPG